MLVQVNTGISGSPQPGFNDIYKNKIYKVEVIGLLFLTH